MSTRRLTSDSIASPHAARWLNLAFLLDPSRVARFPPVDDISAPDYVRGLVDGDGSVGFTDRGYPFVSFVSASESLARYFEQTVLEVAEVTRHSNPNTRDGVYNVMVCNEPAVRLSNWLYYPQALALNRKAEAAAEVSRWTPPSSRFGVTRKAWTPEQDAIVLAHSNPVAAELLSRTVQSVNLRRWRLNGSARRA